MVAKGKSILIFYNIVYIWNPYSSRVARGKSKEIGQGRALAQQRGGHWPKQKKEKTSF